MRTLSRSILPVMVVATDPDRLPFDLAVTHFVDYTQELKEAYRGPVRSLDKLSEPVPLPDPLPRPPDVPVSPISGPSHLLHSHATLDRAQQVVLLDELQNLRSKPKLVGQVTDLLLRFRAKDYVIASVRDQIDALLLSIQANDDARSASLPATAERLRGEGASEDALAAADSVKDLLPTYPRSPARPLVRR